MAGPRDYTALIPGGFGEALRARRAELGISQEQLALGSGIDRVYVSELERGRKSPTLRTICKLSFTLEVKPSALLAAAEQASLD